MVHLAVPSMAEPPITPHREGSLLTEERKRERERDRERRGTERERKGGRDETPDRGKTGTDRQRAYGKGREFARRSSQLRQELWLG